MPSSELTNPGGITLAQSGRIISRVTTLLAATLLTVAAVGGLTGAAWLLLDAFGAEWDYCPGGSDCIAGWKMGVGFTVGAVLTGLVGARLLRRER